MTSVLFQSFLLSCLFQIFLLVCVLELVPSAVQALFRYKGPPAARKRLESTGLIFGWNRPSGQAGIQQTCRAVQAAAHSCIPWLCLLCALSVCLCLTFSSQLCSACPEFYAVAKRVCLHTHFAGIELDALSLVQGAKDCRAECCQPPSCLSLLICLALSLVNPCAFSHVCLSRVLLPKLQNVSAYIHTLLAGNYGGIEFGALFKIAKEC